MSGDFPLDWIKVKGRGLTESVFACEFARVCFSVYFARKVERTAIVEWSRE